MGLVYCEICDGSIAGWISSLLPQEIATNLSQLNVISQRRCQKAVALGYFEDKTWPFHGLLTHVIQ